MKRIMTTRLDVSTSLFAIALLGFAVASLAWLNQPGPYYDEWIFVPVSLRTIGNCGIEAAVTHHLGCFPLTQSPAYVGAIKAWLMAPIFLLFDVSEWTVRAPPIVGSAIALWLVFRFSRLQLGPWGAGLSILILAIDPAFVWHSRLDWGPFVIANLCKIVAFVALWHWLEAGKRRYLLILLGALCIGLFDKLNFLWVTASLGAAACLLEPRVALARLREAGTREWIYFSVAAALHLFAVWALVLPATEISGFEDAPFSKRASYMWHFVNHTFGGTSVYDWMFTASQPIASWPAWTLAALLVASMPAIWLSRSHRTGGARLLRYSCVITICLLICMLATRQTGGSHHLIVLWPFPVLIAASLCVVASTLGGGFKAVTNALGVVAFMVVGMLGLRTHLAYARQLENGGPYRPLFDPALVDVSDHLKTLDVDRIASGHWGLHQSLASLAQVKRRSTYSNWWAIFSDLPETDLPRTHWLKREFLSDRTVAIVEWIHPDFPQLPGTEAHLAYWGACELQKTNIIGSNHVPLVSIRIFGFGKRCMALSPS